MSWGRLPLLYRVIQNAVFCIQQQPLGLDRFPALRPRHDGYPVAGADQMSGGPVHDNLSAVCWPGDNIGFQPLAIGDRGDQDLFPFPQVDLFHEIGGDGDAAFVIDIGVSDGGAMKLGFEESA